MITLWKDEQAGNSTTEPSRILRLASSTFSDMKLELGIEHFQPRWTLSGWRKKEILQIERELQRTDLTEAATMAGAPPDLLFRAIFGEGECYHPHDMVDSFHPDHHRYRDNSSFHLQQCAGLIHINTSCSRH